MANDTLKIGSAVPLLSDDNLTTVTIGITTNATPLTRSVNGAFDATNDTITFSVSIAPTSEEWVSWSATMTQNFYDSVVTSNALVTPTNSDLTITVPDSLFDNAVSLLQEESGLFGTQTILKTGSSGGPGILPYL